MIIIYVLLVIIAVGILVQSETGKIILKLIAILAGVGGILFLGFWLVVFLIGILSPHKDAILNGLYIIFGLGFLTFALHPLFKRISNISQN